MKAAAYLQEALLDSKIAKSQEPNETAFNLAFSTNLPEWEWFEQKGNEHRLLRFGIAMEGTKQATPLNAILEGMCLHLQPSAESHSAARIRLEGSQAGRSRR